MSSDTISIKGGYNFKVKGKAGSDLETAASPKVVAFCPFEFERLKVLINVKEGDRVKRGSLIFHDKNNPSARFLSPVSGTVKTIDIGRRRVFRSIQIEVSGNESESLTRLDAGSAAGLSDEKARQLLSDNGLWPLLKTSPLDRIPTATSKPQDIYVMAYSLQPNTWDPSVIIGEYNDQITTGLNVLKAMGPVTVLSHKSVPDSLNKLAADAGVNVKVIKGKYGTDSAYAYAFSKNRLKAGNVLWHLDIQAAGLIGRSVLTGEYPAERIVAFNGTGLKKESRKHYKITQGASLADSVAPHYIDDSPKRVVSGGLLNGAAVESDGFLFFHQSALNVIQEDKPRAFLHIFVPGFNMPSYSKAFASSLFKGKEYEYYADINGEERACIQCGFCTEVCPVDLMPDTLFKSSLADDYDQMEHLNIFDCSDCGLCSFVCTSKINVNTIIKDGVRKLIDEE